MAGFGPRVGCRGWRVDDGLVQIVNEGEVQKIGERIGRHNLVSLGVCAAEPAIGGACPGKLRVAWGEERPVIVIDQRIKPGIGFQTLVAIVDFPRVLAPGFAQGQTSTPCFVVGVN